MKKKRRPIIKFSLSFFITIFLLSVLSLYADGWLLKPNIVGAAEPAVSISVDDPGIIRAVEVQSRYTEILMGIPDVVGHGIGISPDGQPVIKIFVKRAGVLGIPTMLEGVPTKVELTGMVLAYADPTAKFDRPVPIGVSTGHPEITAGLYNCPEYNIQRQKPDLYD